MRCSATSAVDAQNDRRERAIAEGRDAARGIDRYLMGETALPAN